MISIRPSVEDDWTELRDARLTALRTAPEAYGSTYEREVAFEETTWRERTSQTAQRCCLVAVDGLRIVGMATGLADEEIGANERMLVGMWIFPAYRGQGIADRLTAGVAQWARAAGADTLVLDVSIGNDAARHAYLRNGFRPTGQTRSLPGRPGVLEETLVLALHA